MKLLFACAALGACLSLAAEIIWSEDGSNLITSKVHSTKGWYNAKIDMTPIPGGGFVLASPAQSYRAIRPNTWITFEISKVEKLPGNQLYYAWTFAYPRYTLLAGHVTNFPEGLYTLRLSELKAPMEQAISLYNYNLRLHFKYLRLETEPENSLDVDTGGKTEIKVGDTLVFTLKLKEPCEDLATKLFYETGQGIVPFKLNGISTLDFKPIDESCKVWKATVKIASLKPDKLDTRKILVKVSVLGGKLDTPIFTNVPAALVPTPSEK